MNIVDAAVHLNHTLPSRVKTARNVGVVHALGHLVEEKRRIRESTRTGTMKGTGRKGKAKKKIEKKDKDKEERRSVLTGKKVSFFILLSGRPISFMFPRSS